MFAAKVEEKLIAEKFGDGRQVDVSDITVEFDLAAQIGRNMGSLGASSCIIGREHKKICIQQGEIE